MAKFFLFSTLHIIMQLSFGQEAKKAFPVKDTGHGKHVILVPGMGCSGEIWDETVWY